MEQAGRLAGERCLDQVLRSTKALCQQISQHGVCHKVAAKNHRPRLTGDSLAGGTMLALLRPVEMLRTLFMQQRR